MDSILNLVNFIINPPKELTLFGAIVLYYIRDLHNKVIYDCMMLSLINFILVFTYFFESTTKAMHMMISAHQRKVHTIIPSYVQKG